MSHLILGIFLTVSSIAHGSCKDLMTQLPGNWIQPGAHFDTLIWPPSFRVLSVGEAHNSLTAKKRVITVMEKEKPTHLALEMFEQHSQAFLDRFMKGEIPESQILELLESWKGWHPDLPNAYLQVVLRARELGIRLIALDIKVEANDYWRDPNEALKRRNNAWANAIEHVFARDDSARVLVYGGALHFGFAYQDSVNRLLESRLNTKTRSIKFSGAYAPPTDVLFKAEEIAVQARGKGMGRAEFFAVEDNTIDRNADLYWHLPQIEDASAH